MLCLGAWQRVAGPPCPSQTPAFPTAVLSCPQRVSAHSQALKAPRRVLSCFSRSWPGLGDFAVMHDSFGCFLFTPQDCVLSITV